MWSQSRTRAFVAAVIAGVCASAGCLNPHLNPFPAYPPYPGYGYPPYPPPDKSAPPPVDNRPADSVIRTQYQSPPGTPPGSVGLPQPQPVPPTQPQDVPPPRSLGGDPHKRGTATNTGELLGLGPNELPIDRTLELTKRLDELIAENKRLQARIVALEANGLGREQSLNEAIREVQRATDMMKAASADVQTLRTELAALREKLKKVEQGEIETLKKVVETLQQLLDDK